MILVSLILNNACTIKFFCELTEDGRYYETILHFQKQSREWQCKIWESHLREWVTLQILRVRFLYGTKLVYVKKSRTYII